MVEKFDRWLFCPLFVWLRAADCLSSQQLSFAFHFSIIDRSNGYEPYSKHGSTKQTRAEPCSIQIDSGDVIEKCVRRRLMHRGSKTIFPRLSILLFLFRSRFFFPIDFTHTNKGIHLEMYCVTFPSINNCPSKSTRQNSCLNSTVLQSKSENFFYSKKNFFLFQKKTFFIPKKTFFIPNKIFFLFQKKFFHGKSNEKKTHGMTRNFIFNRHFLYFDEWIDEKCVAVRVCTNVLCAKYISKIKRRSNLHSTTPCNGVQCLFLVFSVWAVKSMPL